MQKISWKRFSLSFIASLLFSSSVFATSSSAMTDYFSHSFWHPIVAFTTGVAFNSDAGDSSKNIPAHDGVFSFFNYDGNTNTTHAYPLFGGFLGTEFLLDPAWSLQAGVGYYQPSSFDATGTVTQGVDIPSSNQYQYAYQIESHQLLAESKLLYNWERYHPYISAGVGASWNDSQNFSVDIQPPFTTFSNQFKDHTTASFSYSVGAGIDFDIAQNVRLGLGYRFADFGQAKTGHGVIDTIDTTNSLSQSHLYTNEIQVQFTFALM